MWGKQFAALVLVALASLFGVVPLVAPAGAAGPGQYRRARMVSATRGLGYRLHVEPGQCVMPKWLPRIRRC